MLSLFLSKPLLLYFGFVLGYSNSQIWKYATDHILQTPPQFLLQSTSIPLLATLPPVWLHFSHYLNAVLHSIHCVGIDNNPYFKALFSSLLCFPKSIKSILYQAWSAILWCLLSGIWMPWISRYVQTLWTLCLRDFPGKQSCSNGPYLLPVFWFILAA